MEICIDSWPLIPTYLEIEAANEEDIYRTLKLLNLQDAKTTTLDVASIYKDIYNIDSLKMPVLKFD